MAAIQQAELVVPVTEYSDVGFLDAAMQAVAKIYTSSFR